MSEFIVHSIAGSPFGRAVLIALEEKSAPYRVCPVAPANLRAAPHLARHPFGRVPVLEHGDFHLYETQAILRYLDRVLPHPPLTPGAPRTAARMDQLMNVNDWYLFHGVGNVIAFQRIVAPRLMGRAPDEAAIAAALPRARQVLGELAALLGAQPYCRRIPSRSRTYCSRRSAGFPAATPEWEALAAPHQNLAALADRMNARARLAATTRTRGRGAGRSDLDRGGERRRGGARAARRRAGVRFRRPAAGRTAALGAAGERGDRGGAAVTACVLHRAAAPTGAGACGGIAGALTANSACCRLT
jgi:glutathione S-transferase